MNDKEMLKIWHATAEIIPQCDHYLHFGRAIEQAVLQSPEVQILREDSARYLAFRKAMSLEDMGFLEAVQTHIENAIDNADGSPTEDQIDAAIDAAIAKE